MNIDKYERVKEVAIKYGSEYINLTDIGFWEDMWLIESPLVSPLMNVAIM
jgi:hypothetical protein